MKFCGHCHKWLGGSPMYCPDCGCTWDYRYCSRGHENEQMANYCSICGSPDLSQCSGKERWFSKLAGIMSGKFGRIILIGIAILMLCSISKQGFELIMSFIIAIAILVIGIWIAFNTMPSFLKNAFRWLWHNIWESINSRDQNGRQ